MVFQILGLSKLKLKVLNRVTKRQHQTFKVHHQRCNNGYHDTNIKGLYAWHKSRNVQIGKRRIEMA
jgi:hypothetical protein